MENEYMLYVSKKFLWFPKLSAKSKKLLWLTKAYKVQEDVTCTHDGRYWYQPAPVWYTSKEWMMFILTTSHRVSYE